jgi:hypothetical protein
VFATYMLGLLPRQTLSSILMSLLAGLVGAVVLMFGNEMLVTSWLFASLCSALLLTFLYTPLHKLPGLLRLLLQVGCFIIKIVFFFLVIRSVLATTRVEQLRVEYYAFC